MDDASLELLSRAVDGDLSPRERQLLEERAGAEPELKRALADLGRMRQSIATLAERMEPPDVLDRLMAPLRWGGGPGRSAVRSPLRWLGVAAAVAMAILIGYQIGQRKGAQPSLAALRQAARTPGTARVPYQLQPLPSSPASDSEQPLGATERLLAHSPRPPEPGEPEGLAVVGPVILMESVGTSAEPRVVLRAEDSAYVLPCPVLAGCADGSQWSVGVVIRDGRIIEVLVEEFENETLRACSSGLLGVGTPGLQDGSYSGEVLTGPPR